ncbi:hypothetical protein ACJX0J_030664 [Zea mays]
MCFLVLIVLASLAQPQIQQRIIVATGEPQPRLQTTCNISYATHPNQYQVNHVCCHVVTHDITSQNVFFLSHVRKLGRQILTFISHASLGFNHLQNAQILPHTI